MFVSRLRFHACSIIVIVALVGVTAGADEELELAKLIASVEPSVVTIEVADDAAEKGFAFSGSGFIVSAEGIIATCYHVVAGTKGARVKLADGTSLDVSGFVAIAPGKDLILLKVKSPRKLPPLRIADLRPHKGDTVFTFGAPRGLAGSVSDGIVSAVRKGVEVRQVLKETTGKDVYSENLHYDLDAIWIQTTAPISAGNSGGPLIDPKGDVVGLNTWVRQGGQNLNFAVAATFALRLLKDAEEQVRAFAELPKLDDGAGTAVNGDGQKTLMYWTKLNRAKQDRADAMARIKTLGSTATSKQRANAAFETAKAWRNYFEVVKAITVDDVDLELLAVATLDAQYSEKMTNALQTVIQLFDAKKSREAATAFRAGCGRLAEPLVQIQDEYDFLRIALNARYKLQFPAMCANAALVQDDRDAKAAEEAEQLAAKTLAIGKEFLNSLDKRKQALAEGWFKKVVSQYPGTAAAAEAAKLLDEMD